MGSGQNAARHTSSALFPVAAAHLTGRKKGRTAIGRSERVAIGDGIQSHGCRHKPVGLPQVQRDCLTRPRGGLDEAKRPRQ